MSGAGHGGTVDRAGVPALDGLRGVAAAMVVVTHVAFWTGNYTPDTVGRLFARADVAVAVFFALSGFLLSRPMFRAAAAGRPAPSARRFLLRRAWRILPAYWLAVALALLVLPGNRDAGAGTWIGHLAFAQLYAPTWARDGLAQTWSLATEVSFYLLLPLLVRRLVGRRWAVRRVLTALAACSVLGLAWLALVTADDSIVGPLNLWLPAFAGWFASGMALAALAVDPVRAGAAGVLRALADSPGTCLAGAAVLMWIGLGPVAGPIDLERPTVAQALAKNVLYLAVAALVLLPLTVGRRSGGWWGRLLSARPLVALGKVSYGLFLVHMTVLIGLYELLDLRPFSGRMPAVLVLVAVPSLVAAVISYRWIEMPLMSAGMRRLDARPVPTPDPTRSVGGEP